MVLGMWFWSPKAPEPKTNFISLHVWSVKNKKGLQLNFKDTYKSKLTNVFTPISAKFKMLDFILEQERILEGMKEINETGEDLVILSNYPEIFKESLEKRCCDKKVKDYAKRNNHPVPMETYALSSTQRKVLRKYKKILPRHLGWSEPPRGRGRFRVKATKPVHHAIVSLYDFETLPYQLVKNMKVFAYEHHKALNERIYFEKGCLEPDLNSPVLDFSDDIDLENLDVDSNNYIYHISEHLKI